MTLYYTIIIQLYDKIIMTFSGHNVYMMSVAKLCKDLGQFTDVTLQCSGNVNLIKQFMFDVSIQISNF
jgi:hypothetical protein